MAVDKEQRVRDLLRDIVEWSARCGRHIGDLTYDEFVADEKTLDAVTKCVEAVGTAAKTLMEEAPEIEAAHPQLALRRAYATRIRLAHGYRNIDPKILWSTATRSIPASGAAARQVLAAGRVKPR